VTQGEDPKFKPQYPPQKKEKEKSLHPYISKFKGTLKLVLENS
jgi:hypothetical protein